LAHHELRIVRHEGVDKHQNLPQVILRPGSADEAGEPEWITTGLPANGGAGRRDSQSSAFLRTPELDSYARS
jgi:hypothetical protein